MIISQLTGGLGNQMFQYAAAKSFALYHNQSLLLDTNYYQAKDRSKKDTHRDYGLDDFSFTTRKIPFAISQLIRYLDDDPQWESLKRSLIIHNLVEVKTDSENILSRSHSPITYFKGYWQSPDYFLKHAKDIKTSFTFKNSVVMRNTEAKSAINKYGANSVMIHVRRGDYVSDRAVSEIMHTLELDYYSRAITYLQNIIETPHYHVFSDDPDWAKQKLIKIISDKSIDFYPFSNSKKPIDDLYLMSICANQIIANSTFSWWAAWLNQYPNKQVVAPKKWYKNQDSNSIKVVPDKWQRI